LGTPGVKLNIPKASLIAAIKNANGRVSKIAVSLGCAIETVRKYIGEDEELVQMLKDYRQHRDENLLEGAEDTLQKAIDTNDPDNMANALKASMFVLNSKGKNRGYFSPHGLLSEDTKQHLSDLIKKAKEGSLSQHNESDNS
jgi:hypothetical protein